MSAMWCIRLRRSTRVVGIAAAALATASVGLWPSAMTEESAQATPAHHAKPPYQQVVPLVGSGAAAPQVVVFARYQTRRSPTGVRRTKHGQLLTVSAHGTVRVLGPVSRDMRRFSLSGDFLTAASHEHPRAVYWWKVTNHVKRGVGRVAAGDTYRAAAPDGWVESTPAGVLKDNPARHGATTSIAQPFGDNTGKPLHVVSGPSGWVASNHTSLAYVDGADGEITALDASTSWHQSDAYPDCWSASATAAACGTVRGENRLAHASNYNNFLAPLDGGQQPEQSQYCGNVATTIGGTAMAWECTQPARLRRGGQVGLVAQIARRRYALPGRTGVGPVAPVAGPDRFVTTNVAQTKGVAFTPDLSQRSVFLPRVRSTR